VIVWKLVEAGTASSSHEEGATMPVTAGSVRTWSMRLVIGTVVLGVTAVATAPVDAAPAERRHCDTRLASDRVPTWDFPVLSVTTEVGFLHDQQGTKVRIDRRAEGYQSEFPTEGPVGTMYRLTAIGPPFGPSAPWTLWVLERDVEMTPQFERCAARLREIPVRP
jgi:hypothetical protein